MFEPSFTKVAVSDRKNIGSIQTVVEVKLPTNDDVNEVYSVGAKSSVTNVEITNGYLDFVGLVDFQVMYRNSAMISAFDYSAEFKDRFNANKDILGEIVVNSNVIDVTSQVSANGVKVVAIVELIFDEIVSRDINVLTGISGNGIFSSTKSIDYETYLGKAYEKFDVTHEFEIKNAKNILMVTPCVSLSSVTPKENYIAISGTLGIDVCYLTGENKQDIASSYYNTQFDWEVAYDGVVEESLVQSAINLIYNEIKVSSTPDEQGCLINIYVPIIYNGYVFIKNRTEAISDVYSSENYISQTHENYKSICCGNGSAFKDNISGVASISDTAPFIDEVLGVTTCNIALARNIIDNEKLVVEGVANASVIYYTKETDELTSVQVEIPFAIEQKVDVEKANIVSMCLSDIDVKSKRGKEIEVSAKLNIFTDLYSDCEENIISEIALSDARPIDDSALLIYIVKPGQTLWDISKELGVSSELIAQQNEGLCDELSAGDKIVVYRPKVMKF